MYTYLWTADSHKYMLPNFQVQAIIAHISICTQNSIIKKTLTGELRSNHIHIQY
jgi:hypothetical protein